MLFKRRRKASDAGDATDTDAEASPDAPSPVASEPVKQEDVFRAQGPWDASEAVPEAQRVDFGSLLIPVASDVQLQANIAKQHNKVIGVTVITGKTALQVQPCAAPKSSGLWDEVRAEIVEEVTNAGAKPTEFEGTFGTEVRAVVPVPDKKDDNGNQLGQPMRFIGVDGPRWLLRGVIRGEGAVEPAAAARVEEIFQNIVVVRGDMPVPPRDLLEMRLPPQAQRSAAGVGTQDGAERSQEEAATRLPGDSGQ